MLHKNLKVCYIKIKKNCCIKIENFAKKLKAFLKKLKILLYLNWKFCYIKNLKILLHKKFENFAKKKKRKEKCCSKLKTSTACENFANIYT